MTGSLDVPGQPLTELTLCFHPTRTLSAVRTLTELPVAIKRKPLTQLAKLDFRGVAAAYTVSGTASVSKTAC